MQGVLQKKSNFLKQWNQRYFVYDEAANKIRWYKLKQGEKHPKITRKAVARGEAKVKNVKLLPNKASNLMTNKFRFNVNNGTQSPLVELAADTEAERSRWIAAFR
jgi:hypothetical protein